MSILMSVSESRLKLIWQRIISGASTNLTHPVLVDDIDDDDEAAVVLAVVHQGHPPDLHEPLERLHKHNNSSSSSNNNARISINPILSPTPPRRRAEFGDNTLPFPSCGDGDGERAKRRRDEREGRRSATRGEEGSDAAGLYSRGGGSA
uniref:Uncharacterized protein n=1 Tax=Oryza brachyantha TaxID=4533 RepID=J3LZK1_ORYBR